MLIRASPLELMHCIVREERGEVGGAEKLLRLLNEDWRITFERKRERFGL
jgi:hypothetical protein